MKEWIDGEWLEGGMDCWPGSIRDYLECCHRPRNRIDARHLTGHVTARAECDQSVAGATARWRDDSDLGQAPLIKLWRALYHSLLPLVWKAPSVSGSSPAVSSEPDHVRSSAWAYYYVHYTALSGICGSSCTEEPELRAGLVSGMMWTELTHVKPMLSLQEVPSKWYF